MIDIVTVVFEQEISILRAQAQSIALNCQRIGIRNIYVVLNDTETIAGQIDPAWWGPLASNVLIIPRSAFSTPFVADGWLSQQVLKLLTASMSYNTYSMILDAKTLFVRELDPATVVDETGRILAGRCPIYPVFEPSKKIVEQLFEIELTEQLGPGGVPFFVEPSVTREMIQEVEHRTGQDFSDYFQQQGRLTEFILYSGYVWYRDQSFSKRYHPQSRILPCNLCHSETGIFDSKFNTMNQPDTLTVSIHRNAWSKLNNEQQQQYHTLLAERGIL